MGPPGSGKGTYASRIAAKLKIPHISTGDILRGARDDPKHGKTIREYQDKGLPVPDEIITKMILDRLSRPDTKNGFIFDTPYNVEQAKAIDKFVKIDAVVNLAVSEDISIKRLASRRVCRKCGETYNLATKILPKKPGICDKCGGELYQRSDDSTEAVKERLRIYDGRAKPMLEYYREKGNLAEVECEIVDIPPEEMVDRIFDALRGMGLNVNVKV